MGPLGYSRRLLLEKWMRDAKINDIFEGTRPDQPPDHRPPHPRLLEPGAEVTPAAAE